MEVLINESMKPILYSPNMLTIGLLKAAWGKDTQGWVGETGRISIIEQLSYGKLVNIIVVKPLTNPNKASGVRDAQVAPTSTPAA